MANLTEERLREMEDEMDRFEMEILTAKIPPPPPPASTGPAQSTTAQIIIGAGTFNQVQARIEEPPRKTVAGPTLPHTMQNSNNSNMSYSNSGYMQQDPNNSSFYNIRPPPPPPSFMPPQLRHRPMPPPPRPPFLPRPPMNSHQMGGMPHSSGPPPMGRMFPPPPPPQMHGNYSSAPGLPRPPMSMFTPPPGFSQYAGNQPSVSQPPPSFTSTSVIRQAKVVYSAAPVRNKIVKTKEDAATTECSPANTATVESKGESLKPPPAKISKQSKAIEMDPKSSSSEKTDMTSNIQLNVPVNEIESEKRQKSGQSAPIAGPSGEGMSESDKKREKKEKDKKRKYVRMAAGSAWEDPTLSEWDPDDFRIFCGDLGNEVTDENLGRAFSKYPSFQKARVIRDKRTNKTKGFGFVSLKDPNDFVRAIREMNGKYVGNRPIKLRKSTWQDRQIDIVKKKEREKKRLGFK